MDPSPVSLGVHRNAAAESYKPFFSLSANGAIKKNQQQRHVPLPPAADDGQCYLECLKNHAARFGGHALDGCGEFMPPPISDPADPTSIRCAACGCHRNFHRRHQYHMAGGSDEEDDDYENLTTDEEQHRRRRRRRLCHNSSSPSPNYLSSTEPHMLLALSTGAPTPGCEPAQPNRLRTTASAMLLPRKRFRTKFSTEQKEKMLELAEKLGWRLQKRKDEVVEEICRRIGIAKGVFKVWMHNNKQSFLSSSASRRMETRLGPVNGAGGGGVVIAHGEVHAGDSGEHMTVKFENDVSGGGNDSTNSSGSNNDDR